MANALRAVDELLGPVRFCAECREWWPDDSEFWSRDSLTSCRACIHERWERRRVQNAAAVRRHRERRASQATLGLV